MVATDPTLLQIPNQNHGDLPLHVACSYRASANVLRALVQAFPEGAGIANRAGSYPLHLVCDYGCASVESIAALVASQEGAQSVLWKDAIYRRTPLYLLNERKNMSTFHTAIEELRSCRQRQRAVQEIGDFHDMNQGEFLRLEASIAHWKELDVWIKAQYLIVAEYYRRAVSPDDVKSANMIHACIGIQSSCPPSLLEYSILLNPHQLLERDDQGRLPLHLAAQVSEPSVVTDILLACPRAARATDAHGNFALSIFLRHHTNWDNWSGTIELLVLANPLAIYDLDYIQIHWYPFLWSKLTRRMEMISVLYESIRGNPSLFAAMRNKNLKP